MKTHKLPVYLESLFNILYLSTAVFLGIRMLLSGVSAQRTLFGIMALILVCGDACHLIPRIAAGFSSDRRRFVRSLGFGKMITSVSMTLFYVILWHIGVTAFSLTGIWHWTLAVYSLAALRIIISVLPQNRWSSDSSPVSWAVYRNIPFLMLGGMACILFFLYRATAGFEHMWLAILLSFAFYLPVVIWSKKYTPIGMLMLPKSCIYIWIITMGL